MVGAIDTFIPLVLPAWFGGTAFDMFLLRQFFMTIPKELDEAAKIDGAGHVKIFFQIVLPLSKPALVSVALFAFMGFWNDFQGPLIYINTVAKYPATLGLKLIQDAETGIEWNKVLALSVVSIIPTLTVFFLAQRQFIDGIAMGGVKG